MISSITGWPRASMPTTSWPGCGSPCQGRHPAAGAGPGPSCWPQALRWVACLHPGGHQWVAWRSPPPGGEKGTQWGERQEVHVRVTVTKCFKLAEGTVAATETNFSLRGTDKQCEEDLCPTGYWTSYEVPAGIIKLRPTGQIWPSTSFCMSPPS